MFKKPEILLTGSARLCDQYSCADGRGWSAYSAMMMLASEAGNTKGNDNAVIPGLVCLLLEKTIDYRMEGP